MDPVRKIDISLSFILSHISSFDIYRYYLGGEVSTDHAFRNVLRHDRNPSMRLRVDGRGCLMHIDFGDPFYKGGCVDIVSQAFGLKYDQALRKIASDFGLLDRGSVEYKRIVSGYCQPVIDPKRYSLIQVSVRQWEKKDVQYWGSYGITKEELRKEEVYPVKELWLNRRKQHIGKEEAVYAYRYKDGYKIYFPAREKKHRWLSNISTSLIEGMERLNGHDKVLITKAKKDRMALQAIFPDMEILNVQNETCSCFTDSVVERLKHKEVWINFDSDDPGVVNCKKIVDKYGYRYINVPRELMPLKDFADVNREYGKEIIIQHFNKKGLI